VAVALRQRGVLTGAEIDEVIERDTLIGTEIDEIIARVNGR
jgi:hypothetical protein